jgi:hypothetical protein
MHEPELGVHQIQVVVQALAFAAEQFKPAGLVSLADLEAVAGLDGADQADDPVGDPVRSAIDLANSSLRWARLRVFT